MKRTATKALLMVAGIATAGLSSAVCAQTAAPAQTPKGWSYQVDQRGNRIARNNRVVRPDGSWREEIRQGNCVTIKERAATGEYKESRQCNPGNPR